MVNEKRLIDANALKERAINMVTVNSLGNKQHCYFKAVGTDEIDKAPTVDAVEVVHGRWEIKEYPITGCKKITCSICSYWVDRGPAWNKNWGFHHYCPNCGAKMDGGNEDGG